MFVTDTSRRWTGATYFDELAHTLRLEFPNDYREYDIGTKNVRYPDGTTRRVKTKKVVNTDLTSFLVFDQSTQFS